mgnify:CR=1 FL=1
MPESTIADFVARFLPDSNRQVDPTKGRVVLSQKRLVLVSGDGRTTIPLADVFDVVVGHVPVGLSKFFDDTVAIAYARRDDRMTAIVEADGETITRFRTVLFKALLQGCSVSVRHPAQIGGRRTGAAAQTGELRLREGAVRLVGLEEPLTIELSAVTHFSRVDRTMDGETRPTLEVQFTDAGRTITSEIVLSTPRRMNLLGRYLRLEYSNLAAEIRDIELPDSEVQLLTAIYSGADLGDLSGVLGMESSSVMMLVNSIEEKGLLVTSEEGTTLTSLGRLAVSDRVEDING